MNNFLFWIHFWLKIGYHSNFNPECNRENGFINQLFTELGNNGSKYFCSFLHFSGHLEVVYNISLVQVATFCLSMQARQGHWLTICYIISVFAKKQVSVQLIFILSITIIVIQCLHWIGLIPKYRSKQISPQCCRCSILLD